MRGHGPEHRAGPGVDENGERRVRGEAAGALGVGEDGGGAAGEGLGGEVGAVGAGARQRGEEVAGMHVGRPQGHPRDRRRGVHIEPVVFRGEDGGELIERHRADRVRSCGGGGRGGGGDRSRTGGGHGAEATGGPPTTRTRPPPPGPQPGESPFR